VFHVVDRVMEAGLDPRRFAADMLDRFRDLIVLSAVPDAGQTGLIDAPADRLQRMAEQAGRFGQAQLTRTAEVLSEGLVQMRGATAPRLLLELTCAQALLPEASSGHSALLARLERLERTAGARPAAPATAPEGPGAPAAAPGPLAPATEGPGTAAAAPVPAPHVPAPARPASSGDGADASAAAPGASARTQAEDPPQPPGPSAAAADVPAPPRPAARRGQAGGPRPAPAAAPAAPPDAQSLRGDWDAVLDAVKRVRRVAWMLLRTASVQSLADGVLTVRFARAGDVKGFVSSECDADLERVLAQSFGLKVKVRAVSGPPDRDRPEHGGSTGAVRENPEDSFRTAPAPARAQQPEPARGNQPRPADSAAPPAGHDSGDGDPFDVRDPDASAGDDALTGVDLIKRELGGQVVDETGSG